MDPANIYPPCSALFFTIGPGFDEKDLRQQFSNYGNVEHFSSPTVKDRNGKRWTKGFGFVKYFTASEAAKAMESLQGTEFPSEKSAKTTIKITVQHCRKEEGNIEKQIVPTLVSITLPEPDNYTIEKVKSEFGEYGKLKKAYYYKGNERVNLEYELFSEAAACVESCRQTYRAYFVLPTKKNRELIEMRDHGFKRAYPGMDGPMMRPAGPMIHSGFPGPMMGAAAMPSFCPGGMMAGPVPGFGHSMPALMGLDSGPPVKKSKSRVRVLFCPSIKKNSLIKIFNIVPGYLGVELKEVEERGAVAVVTYDNPASAEHAADRINGLEYPPDFYLVVELDKSSDLLTVVDKSWMTDSKAGLSEAGQEQFDAQLFCSVLLPPVLLQLHPDTKAAVRLFFVIKECLQTPPPELITNLFCRFGKLITAHLLKYKKCGYARYAEMENAQECIRTLNGTTFRGCELIVEVSMEDTPWERRNKPFE